MIFEEWWDKYSSDINWRFLEDEVDVYVKAAWERGIEEGYGRGYNEALVNVETAFEVGFEQGYEKGREETEE